MYNIVDFEAELDKIKKFEPGSLEDAYLFMARGQLNILVVHLNLWNENIAIEWRIEQPQIVANRVLSAYKLVEKQVQKDITTLEKFIEENNNGN